MSAWAKPGAKCIFVGGGTDRPEDWPLLIGKPVKGQVYTVRETHVGQKRHPGELFLRLEETVVKPHGEDWEDAWMYVGNFRPVIERTQEQDVAKFAHLLDQNSIQVSEPEVVS